LFRSKDDPFVLYAAMYSGIDTKILTRDLMRGHKYLLGDATIKSIFQKWLQKHRLRLKIRAGDEVIIKVSLYEMTCLFWVSHSMLSHPFNILKSIFLNHK